MSWRTAARAAFAVALGSTGLAATPALGQAEFLGYPCDATVAGSLVAEAYVWADGSGFFGQSDTDSLAGVYAPTSLDQLAFSGGATAGVRFERTFVAEGCTTTTKATAVGDTAYRFVGDNDVMTIELQSAQDHAAGISRGPFSFGGGGLVTVDTATYQPHSGKFNADIPFIVGGGNGAHMVVDNFTAARTDSGPTTGYTWMSWEVIADANGNCAVDAGELGIASGFISVGPNQSAWQPAVRFSIPRGHYVLVVRYGTQAFLHIESEDCLRDARASSEVRDVVHADFELHHP